MASSSVAIEHRKVFVEVTVKVSPEGEVRLSLLPLKMVSFMKSTDSKHAVAPMPPKSAAPVSDTQS